MQQLAATEESLRAQIADLQEQKGKLADPVFIAAQARERLGFVMPGDTPYQVQLPPSAAYPVCAGRPAGDRRQQRPLVYRAVEDDRRYSARSAAGRCRDASCGGGTPTTAATTTRAARWLIGSIWTPVAAQLGREPRGVLEIAYRCRTVRPVW